MSADNWTFCPQCRKEKKKELDKTSLSDLEKEGELNGEDTSLREDYETGIRLDGTFVVDYQATCEICDFSFKYYYEKQVGVK